MTQLGLVEQRIALATGATIGYVDQGPADRTAVLGLPGWPDPWQSFELVDRATQEALAAAIPDARLVEYPGVGHSPNWEVPDLVAADVLSLRT